ncbi:MAG TPA: hypothetical protein VFS80_00545, partial [Burkholderiales bacterium]|nr:hypothetical protein [Burkholderiales bacterium]
EVAGYCPFSGGVVAGCAALREHTCDIYVRVDHRGDACLAEHERLHCKGRTHSRKLFYEACARPRESGRTQVAVDAFDVTQQPHDPIGLALRGWRPTPPR